jgi:hypothetical protein
MQKSQTRALMSFLAPIYLHVFESALLLKKSMERHFQKKIGRKNSLEKAAKFNDFPLMTESF